MPTKSHSFSQKLMMTSAIEDSVLNDSMLINYVMTLPKNEAKSLLISEFNVDQNTANTILEKQLYLALFEAATKANEEVVEHKKIQSLSKISTTSYGQKLIKRMVHKYEILIELYARKASATANPHLFQMLGSSKRTSKAVKNILEPQIEIARSKMSSSYTINNPKVKQLRLAKLEETFEKVASKIDLKTSFIPLDALIRVADESGQYINKIDQSTCQKIFDLVEQSQQGKQL